MRRALVIAAAFAGLHLAGVVGTPPAARAQGRSGAETEEEQAFQAAEIAFKENRDDEAARLYEKVIALNPARAEAYVKRGSIYYKRKDYSAAVALLRRGQQVLPDDLNIKAQLALSLYKTGGARDIAVGMMEEVVAKNPRAFQVQLQLGEHYIQMADGKAAARAFDAYFQYRPEEAAVADKQVYPLAGVAYLQNRQYPEAQKQLEAALRANPQDLLARVSLATVWESMGDCARAAPALEKLLPSAPRQPAIYYNLAGCYLRARRPEATELAESFTRARPKEPRGWMLLGDARYVAKDYPRALAALEQASAAAPADGGARSGIEARLGKVYLAQRNYPAALKVLESARERHPDDVVLLTQLVEAYAQTGAPAGKLLPLAERLARTTDGEALTAAGVAYYVSGDDALAETSFTAAMAADSHADRARHGLALTLVRAGVRALDKGDLPTAEALLTRAQRTEPESVDVARDLGLVLLLEKKPVEAEGVLVAAARRAPRDLAVNRLLGRCYLALKRKPDALRAYRAAEEGALRLRGLPLAELYAEMGPLLADTGSTDAAVSALETAVRESGSSPVLAAAQRNLAITYLRRGVERMKDARTSEGAYDDLQRAAAQPRGALAPRESTLVTCALAVAALKAGKPAPAQEAFARASREGGCSFNPPYDKIGLELFQAYAQYRDAGTPVRREATARAFARLATRATGALADELRELVRSSYELEGYELYNRGDVRRAQAALKSAQRTPSRGEDRTLAHNLAVIDLADGKSSAARVFEQLGQRPPEALLNLGIVHDRQGDPRRALELYRRAAERGVRAARLKEWIDVKERLLSSGGGK